METLQLTARVGNDGILRLEFPVGVVNRDFEILIVMQPIVPEAVDEMGYPVGYFDRTYGSLKDNPIEIREDLPPDIREYLE